MIPIAHIIEWSGKSPWITMAQIEQDLILSRVLIELYSDPELKENLIFRGGTALHKLFFRLPARYSEDIDLVQIKAGPIGPYLFLIRKKLDSWLGSPTWKLKAGRAILYYRFRPEDNSTQSMRVKIEINTREHFNHFDPIEIAYELENSWFSGESFIKTFCLEELLGTKLRALYQRKKGRDLFDLSIAINAFSNLNMDKVITVFQRYMSHDHQVVSRAEFEANLMEKLEDTVFQGDIFPLLSENFLSTYDFAKSGKVILNRLISKLPGKPWKGIHKK